MKYELAKKLQDAGWTYKDGSRSLGPTATPTLSELIEACGYKIDALNQYDRGNIWVAQSFRWSPIPFTGEGSTPEEAVARLWLKLNKK